MVEWLVNVEELVVEKVVGGADGDDDDNDIIGGSTPMEFSDCSLELKMYISS